MDEDAPSCSSSMSEPVPLIFQNAGHILRKWQKGMELFMSRAQQASAQVQLGALENLQHFSDAIAHPQLRHGRRRRARPTMLCCLTGAVGAGAGASVRLPRSSELANSLSLTKESGEQGQHGTDTAGPGTEEPILISEVGYIAVWVLHFTEGIPCLLQNTTFSFFSCGEYMGGFISLGLFSCAPPQRFWQRMSLSCTTET